MALDLDASPMVDGAGLIGAMALEERLLGDLRTALARQRAGIADDDPATLDAATLIVSRAVLTLEQARRRREQMVQLLTGGEPATLQAVEELSGEIDGLTAARESLRATAQAAVRELALNQAILRRALRSGDAYLQSLFASVTDTSTAYAPREGLIESATRSGVVVNTRA